MNELLTTEGMRAADAAAIASGTSAGALMEAAGNAVAARAADMCAAPGPVLIVCGPGNNGGDGFVAARLLAGRGYDVRLALIGERAWLKGEAAAAASRWSGEVRSFDPSLSLGCGLIVDALFGAGLSRDVDGAARTAVEAINASGKPVLAVDIPSGVDGDTGQVRGAAVRATATVTFFRFKPGHVLMPGRDLCGERHLAQIGIAENVTNKVGTTAYLNRPSLWEDAFPRPDAKSHKYTRGHALVAAGSEMTGAARLAARAALRAGAGVVTIACNPQVINVYRTALEAAIVRPMANAKGYAKLLEDRRRNALLLGPGAGIGEETRDLVRLALASGRPVVLDADALTSFEATPRSLHQAVAASDRDVVMTPHEGEFRRLFRGISETESSKLEQARAAARMSGAVVTFKGADTVVAAPDGRAAVADNAPPWLATAGSGDVLAGIATGLLAQGMPAFEAACAAVWMHGEAGSAVGPGLISEDLPDALMPVLRQILRV